MKKLFVSCPMNGRSDEDIFNTINRLHKITEFMINEELELIQTYIDEEAPDSVCNHAVWFLGKSIELMAEADHFVCLDCDYMNTRFHGCDIERRVAIHYQIPVHTVKLTDFPSVAPDLVDELNTHGGLL